MDTETPSASLVVPPESNCALTTRGQFLALVTSSHPRCGSRSPARQVCSIEPLVATLWDTAVAPTITRCVLVVGAVPGGAVYHVSIGLCQSLGSVSDSPALVDVPRSGITWLTPELFCKVRRGNEIDVQRVGCDRTARIAVERPAYGQAINWKWFVSWGNGDALSVRKLVHSGMDVRVSEAVVAPRRVSEWNTIDMEFNKLNPDEILLRAQSKSGATLTLIDVAGTFQSKITVVLSCAVLALSVLDSIVMRRNSGYPLFMVLARGWEIHAVIDPSTGTSKVVAHKCSSLTQVSSTVFGVWHDTRALFELWDCNSLYKPLREVNPGGYSFEQVISGRSFLFGLIDDKIVVMEAHSQTVVITLQLLLPSQQELYLSSHSSVLY